MHPRPVYYGPLMWYVDSTVWQRCVAALLHVVMVIRLQLLLRVVFILRQCELTPQGQMRAYFTYNVREPCPSTRLGCASCPYLQY